MGQFNWTPPKEAIPVEEKSTWKPPSDAIPVEKKKTLANDSESGGMPLKSGGLFDPSSQAPTSRTTPFTPEYNQHLQDRATIADTNQQVSVGGQLTQADEAFQQSGGQSFNIPQGNPDELKQYTPPTLSSKTAYELKSIAGSLNKGIANMTIAPLYHYANKIGLVSDDEKARVLRDVADSDKETFGLNPQTLQQGGGVHSAINQFAFMAPALITAAGTGGASFGLQSAGSAATQVQKMKDAGVTFGNHSDDLFILGAGIIGTALGRGTMGKAFNSFGSSAKENIVHAGTAEVIKELGESGAKSTAQEIADAFLSKAGTLGGKLTLGTLKTYAKVGSELSAANIATFGTKKLANAISGDEPFKDVQGADLVKGITEPFGLERQNTGSPFHVQANPLQALSDMATSPAGAFGLLGGAGEALGHLGHNPNPTIERLRQDPSPEGVAKVKEDIAGFGTQKGWTPEEIQQAHDGVDLLAQTVGKLPRSLPPEKVQKGVSIIMGRNQLESQLGDLKAEREQLDPAVRDVPSQDEELLTNKIDQANDKLRSLATGDRATYSRGTGEDEGMYFKTVKGVKTEITPERYELENLERDVKAGNVEKPVAPEAVAPVETVPAEVAPPQEVPIEQTVQDNGAPAIPEVAPEIAPPKPIENFTQPETINRDYAKIKADIGEKKAQKYFEQVDKLINPNEHEIVQYRKNGIVTKEGDKYTFHALGDMDMKNWRVAFKNDITDQFKTKEEPTNESAKIASARKMDVGESSRNGETVGEGNAEPSKSAGESHPEGGSGEIPQPMEAEKVTTDGAFDSMSRQINTPNTSETPNTVSSKKASVKEQAESVDVTLKDNKGQTRTKDIVEAEADHALKEGFDVPDLVRKIKDENHVATDTENAILAKHVAASADGIQKLNRRIAEEGANLSESELDALTAKRDKALTDFADVANANDQTRSDAGRALNSGKFKLNDNYSLENMVVRERKLKGDKLTADELAEVTKKHEELEKANEAYERKLKESQDEIARLKAEKKVRPSSTKSKRTPKTHEDYVAERKRIAAEFSQKLADMRKGGQLNDVFSASAQFLAAAAPYVAKMVTSLAHEGVTELGEVVKRLREELDLKDLPLKDMHDLISGKHSEPQTKSDIQAQVRRLKTEASLLSQIEDAERGERTLPESKRKTHNARIDELRGRLKELDKENGLYDEVQIEQSAKRLKKEIAELEGRIARKEFDKSEPTQKDLEPVATRDLRHERDRLRHEYDLDVARRELDKRTKLAKAGDMILNIATVPRAIKATMDFSAVGRQGLFLSPHSKQAAAALKTMFGQTFSEKKYHDWFSDLKNSPQYDLIKASGLYIAEKNNPDLLAREEQFTSNLLEKAPVIGKIHQGAERAYTGYLNAIRTGVFLSEAQKLQERGYTFKNNPKEFKDLATVVNVLSGRGNIPDWLGGKQPAVWSNIFFSPRFVASRIHTLYLWADPRLSRNAKMLAAKDIGKVLGSAGVLLGMATLAGYKVSTDPRSSDFLKIRDGDTRYDILGGLSQYVVFLAQQATGQKVPAGQTGVQSLTTGKYGKPSRLTNAINFGRGKLSPLLGMAANLMDKKDIVGNPYDLSNIPKEFVPLPASDVYDAYKVGGIENALKVLIPSQFGIGVSSFKKKK